ncbi:hypothetical protein LTR86_002209 [Recurvomyces mirabilis]|nr:hypothetical protein LTR86_002209 [Recurvomyces mirabilis]
MGRDFEAIKVDLSRKILATKTPADFIITLLYSIPILAPARICIETGVFKHLAETKSPLHIADLVQKPARGDHEAFEQQQEFLVRMLRAVSGIGLIDEIAPRMYQANELTAVMADEGFASGFELFFDNAMGPSSTMTSMISFHGGNAWRAPGTATEGPWQDARGVQGQTTFEHWTNHDQIQLTRLSSLMQRMQDKRPHWTQWFPKEALIGTPPSDDRDRLPAVFVDVGGGRGHDLSALARQYPKWNAQLVLQDDPSVVAETKHEHSTTGTKVDPRTIFMAHDFFLEQPVKGASIYYMHKIMHDWPDKDCVAILTRLGDAMQKGSRIFINDVILPDQGCSALATGSDILMLAFHSGQERDEASWTRLISMVEGLRIQKFWRAPGDDGEGIIEVCRPNSS